MEISAGQAADDLPRAEQIAKLNDQLRITGTGGAIMITHNVQRVTGFDANVLAAALANYGLVVAKDSRDAVQAIKCTSKHRCSPWSSLHLPTAWRRTSLRDISGYLLCGKFLPDFRIEAKTQSVA